MRGLTLVVADAAPERFRTGLSLAAAQAALGGRSRLFCQGEAVALLRPPVATPSDDRHAACGLPTLAELVEEALALGVELVACQGGLMLTGTDARTLDPRIAAAGLVGLLADLGDDRLVAV